MKYYVCLPEKHAMLESIMAAKIKPGSAIIDYIPQIHKTGIHIQVNLAR